MSPLLLDTNLSPLTSAFLKTTFGLDVVDLVTLGLAALSDDDVVLLAKQEGRVIVTFDLDFGDIYYRRERGKVGVIVLRLEDQRVPSVHRVLDRFFRWESATIDLATSLVVLDGTRLRVVGVG